MNRPIQHETQKAVDLCIYKLRDMCLGWHRPFLEGNVPEQRQRTFALALSLSWRVAGLNGRETTMWNERHCRRYSLRRCSNRHYRGNHCKPHTRYAICHAAPRRYLLFAGVSAVTIFFRCPTSHRLIATLHSFAHAQARARHAQGLDRPCTRPMSFFPAPNRRTPNRLIAPVGSLSGSLRFEIDQI